MGIDGGPAQATGARAGDEASRTTVPPEAGVEPSGGRFSRRSLADWVGRYAVLVVLAAMIIGFSLALPNTFFQAQNFRTIAGQQAVPGLLALALLSTLIAGDFDLSIAGTMTLAGTVAIGLQIDQGWAWPLAVLVSLAIGAFIGFFNSLTVVRLGMNSLIATLAVGTILGGFVSWQTGGGTIYGDVSPQFTDLGRWKFLFDIPGSVVYLVAIGLVLWFLFTRTVFGNYLFATGSNRSAARLSGIQTTSVRTVAFVMTGLLSAFAGVLFAANVGSGQPGIGEQFLLPAFAAAFLGATTLVPGRFNVWGTIAGIYLLAVGLAGLQQLGAPSYVQPIFNGTALLVAIGLSTLLRRNANR